MQPREQAHQLRVMAMVLHGPSATGPDLPGKLPADESRRLSKLFTSRRPSVVRLTGRPLPAELNLLNLSTDSDETITAALKEVTEAQFMLAALVDQWLELAPATSIRMLPYQQWPFMLLKRLLDNGDTDPDQATQDQAALLHYLRPRRSTPRTAAHAAA